jgi:predicted ester cyclase
MRSAHESFHFTRTTPLAPRDKAIKQRAEVFEELFVDDFHGTHTAAELYCRQGRSKRSLFMHSEPRFPIFTQTFIWQAADGELGTTFKTYHGTDHGDFSGLAPTGRSIHFETVDVMHVHNGKITEHWGVANLFSLLQQLGAWLPGTEK